MLNGSEGPGPSPLAANCMPSPSEELSPRLSSAPERAPDQIPVPAAEPSQQPADVRVADSGEAEQGVQLPRREPDQLFLIAHKCRGEAVFEIALRWDFGTPSDPAPWYILQSTGHRVYPFWTNRMQRPFEVNEFMSKEDFAKIRDFYNINLDQMATHRPTKRHAKTIDDLI